MKSEIKTEKWYIHLLLFNVCWYPGITTGSGIRRLDWKLHIYINIYIKTVTLPTTTAISSAAEIQVWIQALKIKQFWRFHDGSLVPDIFHIGMRNRSDEIQL